MNFGNNHIYAFSIHFDFYKAQELLEIFGSHKVETIGRSHHCNLIYVIFTCKCRNNGFKQNE